MKFAAFQDHYSHAMQGLSKPMRKAMAAKGVTGRREFYRSMRAMPSWMIGSHERLSLEAQSAWWEAGRPYYNVWPSIRGPLESLNIESVPIRQCVDVPERAIAVQFPDVGRQGDEVRSVLVAVLDPTEVSRRHINPTPNLWCILMISEWTTGGTDVNGLWEWHQQSSAILVRDDGLDNGARGFSVDQKFKSSDGTLAVWPELVGWQRVAMGVLLMERDPSIVEPDVLSEDADRYETGDLDLRKHLEERAFKRRGQRGYHVGRAMETIPHYRRPHPCLVWTGQGRHVAKVVMRKGAVVKRQKMTEAPTGYYGSFGEADHDEAMA